MATSSRRAFLGTAAALAAALPASPAATAAPPDDAELIRLCHQFAEAEFRNWWRYCTAPDDLADAGYVNVDWTVLDKIETTLATTPAGWVAKALAFTALHREAYDNCDPTQADASATLLAGLLRDMAAPARADILARCEAEYGPLPEGYTADARWIGKALVAVAAPAPLILVHADAELLSACDAYTRARAKVVRLEPTASDDVFDPAVTTMHAAAARVADLRAHTVGGLRAKAAVCQAVLAEDGPAAVEGAFGARAQRRDMLAWSTVRDLVEVAG